MQLGYRHTTIHGGLVLALLNESLPFGQRGWLQPIAVGAFTWRPCWTVWQRMTEMKHFCFWTKRLAATDRWSAWAHGGLSFHLAPLQNNLTRMIGMCIEGALMPTSHQTTVLWHKSNGSYARLINLGWLWSIGCSWAATVKIEIKPSCTACTHISAADKGSIEEVAVWLHSWRNERVCPCTWVVHSSHTHTHTQLTQCIVLYAQSWRDNCKNNTLIKSCVTCHQNIIWNLSLVHSRLPRVPGLQSQGELLREQEGS